MRIISIIAVVMAVMAGVWLFAVERKGGSADWQAPLAKLGGDLKAPPSDVVESGCAMIGDYAQTYSCEVVGNPNAKRWDEASAEHAFARSIWDMEAAAIGSRGERVYFGGGDWGLNQGPVPVWSLFRRKSKEGKPVLRVAPEQPIYGEAVEFIREVDGRLYIPDIDPKDPWMLGNVYALDGDGWHKYRSLENAVHVFDVIGFQGALVASAGIVENDIGFAGLFKSVDDGASWTRLPAPEEEVKLAYRFWRMAEFGDGLFIAQSNARDGFWTLSQDWVLDRHDTDLFPDMLDANLRLTVSRAEKFHDSVLYSPGLERLPIRSDLLEVPLAPAYLAIDHFTAWWDKLRAAWPLVRRNLYRLDEAGEVSVVTLPNAPHVNDFTVIDGTVFVLGVSFHDGYYEATVLSSRDLEDWTELFRVKTPAMACSFAQLEGEWVLGLCADGMSDDNIASGQVLGVRTL